VHVCAMCRACRYVFVLLVCNYVCACILTCICKWYAPSLLVLCEQLNVLCVESTSAVGMCPLSVLVFCVCCEMCVYVCGLCVWVCVCVCSVSSVCVFRPCVL